MTRIKLGEVSGEVKTRVTSDCEIPVYAVTKHKGFVLSTEYFKKQVFSRDVKGYKLVKNNQFAYATIHLDEGSLGLLEDSECIISPMYTVFEVDDTKVFPKYLFYQLKAPRSIAQYQLFGKGSIHRRKSISFNRLSELEVFLPPLSEQKRIAEILDKSNNIRCKRQESIRLAEEFISASFLDMFGDPVNNPNGFDETELDKIALIASGVTKGRKFNDNKTVFAPYMRVANVQDGHIDLSEVKEIEVLEKDVEKYALEKGDLLLTEGGDPDKLGRGAIWNGEVPNCIHQNHIFRVRLSNSSITPEYLSALISSSRGKRYFLRSAKQTTGIASINMTQLKAFPALLPPLSLQEKYRSVLKKYNSFVDRLNVSAQEDSQLFSSLSQKAFKGEI